MAPASNTTVPGAAYGGKSALSMVRNKRRRSAGATPSANKAESGVPWMHGTCPTIFAMASTGEPHAPDHGITCPASNTRVNDDTHRRWSSVHVAEGRQREAMAHQVLGGLVVLAGHVTLVHLEPRLGRFSRCRLPLGPPLLHHLLSRDHPPTQVLQHVLGLGAAHTHDQHAGLNAAG